MSTDFIKKGLSLLTKRQTNILSAAIIIMATIIFSQILGLVRQRLLVSIFGASNLLGIYLYGIQLPDALFQVVIAGALYSAFIPVFSDFLAKSDEKEAHVFASTLLVLCLILFTIISLILFIFAPFFLQIFNLGGKSTPAEMTLMANIMRLVIFGQLLFIVGSFFSAILQSYNRFLIPGFAAAMYNLGIIIGIVWLSPTMGIYAPTLGIVIGAGLFMLLQVPFVKKVGFAFVPTFSFFTPGILRVLHLMWPRTISIGIFQVGALLMVALISFIPNPGRNRVIFDYAQTLAFAPVALFGQAIAQAAFPVLSREKDRLVEFKATFFSSFMQLLYLVLPVSVLFFVLRIPVVRLIYGVYEFDWQATVLTGKVLAVFAISIFAQALLYLVSRAFYALHDTKTPLIVSAIATVGMLLIGIVCILTLQLGITSLAFAYTVASIGQIVVLLVFLDRKTHGFEKKKVFLSLSKIFAAAFFTGVALYIPIKLLDQLVFDTTKTINLLLLTGISSIAGLSLYVFLTWVFNVKEATTFLLLFKRVGNWREILGSSDEVIDSTVTRR
jgi:putative peptidoglycan lipid II flippase